MLGLQGGMTLLESRVFGLQAFELLVQLGKLCPGSISNLGGIRSLALHHGRVLTENLKVLLLLGHNSFELGILFFDLSKPFLQTLCSLIGS
jgi:hypothetical protein